MDKSRCQKRSTRKNVCAPGAAQQGRRRGAANSKIRRRDAGSGDNFPIGDARTEDARAAADDAFPSRAAERTGAKSTRTTEGNTRTASSDGRGTARYGSRAAPGCQAAARPHRNANTDVNASNYVPRGSDGMVAGHRNANTNTNTDVNASN